MEISRVRATGLMLRNCSVPFLLASAAAIVKTATGHDAPVSVIAAIHFAAAAFSVLRSGKRLQNWANVKTLQICYWIPEVDALLRDDSAPPK